MTPTGVFPSSRSRSRRTESSVHSWPVLALCLPCPARRRLVPVDGFYEWFPTRQIGPSGKPLKQPFYIHPADGRGADADRPA
jgi:hypothetical protein